MLPFAKVGTGYSFDELDVLRNKLRPVFKMYNPRNPPSQFGKWSPAAGERPDVSLRFPRVVKIRYDKDWNTLSKNQCT